GELQLSLALDGLLDLLTEIGLRLALHGGEELVEREVVATLRVLLSMCPRLEQADRLEHSTVSPLLPVRDAELNVPVRATGVRTVVTKLAGGHVKDGHHILTRGERSEPSTRGRNLLTGNIENETTHRLPPFFRSSIYLNRAGMLGSSTAGGKRNRFLVTRPSCDANCAMVTSSPSSFSSRVTYATTSAMPGRVSRAEPDKRRRARIPPDTAFSSRSWTTRIPSALRFFMPRATVSLHSFTRPQAARVSPGLFSWKCLIAMSCATSNVSIWTTS